MPNTFNRNTDILIGKTLIQAESISLALRTRLTNALMRQRRSHSLPDLLKLARQILDTFQPQLSKALADSQLAAWILGATAVAKRLPKSVLTEFQRLAGPGQPPPKTFPIGTGGAEIRLPIIDTAVRDLHTRNIVTRPKFDALAGAMKLEAFTIAWINNEETIATIRDVLEQDIAEGTSLKAFKARVVDALGSSPIGAGHLENVYRTNLQAAFSGGQETIASNPVVRGTFPFARISPIDDGRVRETHLSLATLGLDGTNVYLADDPFWQTYSPPLAWQCRCSKTFMTRRQAAQLGVSAAIEWERTGVEPPHESRLPFIPWRPDPTFVGGGRYVA
jgi:hypothetical protein